VPADDKQIFEQDPRDDPFGFFTQNGIKAAEEATATAGSADNKQVQQDPNLFYGDVTTGAGGVRKVGRRRPKVGVGCYRVAPWTWGDHGSRLTDCACSHAQTGRSGGP
jgi:hypothetical protein